MHVRVCAAVTWSQQHPKPRKLCSCLPPICQAIFRPSCVQSCALPLVWSASLHERSEPLPLHDVPCPAQKGRGQQSHHVDICKVGTNMFITSVISVYQCYRGIRWNEDLCKTNIKAKWHHFPQTWFRKAKDCGEPKGCEEAANAKRTSSEQASSSLLRPPSPLPSSGSRSPSHQLWQSKCNAPQCGTQPGKLTSPMNPREQALKASGQNHC